MLVHDYPSNKHGRKWFMFYASESQNENFTIEGWAKKKWWVVFNDAQSKARIWVHLDSKNQFLPSDTRMWQEKKSWVLGIDPLRTWILDKQEASIACEFDEFCLILCFQLYKSIIEHHWTTNTPSIRYPLPFLSWRNLLCPDLVEFGILAADKWSIRWQLSRIALQLGVVEDTTGLW